jgi:hypothetical protein
MFMRNQFIITIDEKVSTEYVLSFLKNITFIKSIQTQKKDTYQINELDEATLLAQNSLAEDWLTEEDNRWDEIL